MEISFEQRKVALTADFKRTLARLAIFTATLVACTYFFNTVFVYIFFLLCGATLSGSALYFAAWLGNEISAYLPPIIALLIIFRKEKTRYARLEGVKPLIDLPICFFSMLAVGSAMTRLTLLISDILDHFFGTGEIPDSMETVATFEEPSYFFIFFLFVCIVGPVFEEVIFRRLLLNPLRKYGDYFAVFVTAVIFGIFHGNFDQAPYAIGCGAIFGIVAVRFGSIFPTIVLHVLNNTLVTFCNYLPAAFPDSNIALSIAQGLTLFETLATLLGVGFLIYGFVKKRFTMNGLHDLPAKERLSIAVRSPASYIAVVCSLLVLLTSVLL